MQSDNDETDNSKQPIEYKTSSSFYREVSDEFSDIFEEDESSELDNFPILPQGNHRKQYLALLKRETKEIKIHYMKFSLNFRKSFTGRVSKGEADFSELSLAAEELFDFDESYSFISEQDVKELLAQILRRQSYMNFDLLRAVIEQCGTENDIKEAEKYIEAFRQYARRRIFECDPDLSCELPGRDIVMFVLDKDQNFKLIDAEDFKTDVCKMLGVKYHKLILHKFEPGSIVIYIQVSKYLIEALMTAPLYYNSILSLKKWNTLLMKFGNSETVQLSEWNVLTSVSFNGGTLVDTKSTKILPVEFEGEECMALEYNETFSNQSLADVGYINYLESLLSGSHKNIPAIKGVYYRQPEGKEVQRPEMNQYPLVVMNKLEPLKAFTHQKEIPEVTQVSFLLNIVDSLDSFSSGNKHEVSIVTESIFIHEGSSEVEAKFCPLYGHSFVSKSTIALHDSNNAQSKSLPISKLQWMNDMVKLIHFQGRVTDQSELPDNHLLQKMFSQKWLAKDHRFRPSDFKTLSKEIQHLLGMSGWVGGCSFVFALAICISLI